MAKEWIANSMNQVAQGEVVYEAGQPIQSIAMVVKGRICAQGNGVRTYVNTGGFLGIQDVINGTHKLTYTAEAHSAIFVFSAKGSLEDIAMILQTKREYAPLMVNSLCKYLSAMAETYETLMKFTGELYNFLKEQYEAYQNIGKEKGGQLTNIKSIASLTEFASKQPPIDAKKVAYYIACLEVNNDVQRGYYGHPVIAIYHLQDQIQLIDDMLLHNAEVSDYIYELSGVLVQDRNNLYSAVATLAKSVRNMGEDTQSLMGIMDNLVDKINETETILIDKAGRGDYVVDRDSMEETYFSLLSNGGTVTTSESSSVGMLGDDLFLSDVGMDSSCLDDSLEQITDYCDFDEEQKEQLIELLEEYKKVSDKTATSDEVRGLRKKISLIYYQLYKKVFMVQYEGKEEMPVAVRLFMDYGLLDETLLSEEHKDELIQIKDNVSNMSPCGVYNMREWFTMVYDGKKEPSKSEFDMDYSQYLRDMRKSGRITEAEQKEMEKDQKKKLEYEMDNVFRYNHRLMCTQPTAFVPFLCSELISGSLDRLFLSHDKINACIRKIVRVDYSLFYREGLYVNEEKGIKKEFIMEEVYPDILVFPMFGDKGVMWQEISGRKRNTPGRFLLPAFCEGNLQDICTKLAGRFRWELCRTMQGSAWNNIQFKSLTSEYSDYVQFFRKNRDLSEEKKEKLKLQIQKARNNTREVFVIDYEGWVKKESQGGICLNKTVRELMATYCPFSKEFREPVQEQPLFRDAMARYNREKGKKLRELGLRYRVLEKEGVELPEELLTNKKFYEEL